MIDFQPDDNLLHLQKILLGMLVVFDRFCEDRGITYYLAGGTLLGAVRGGGFIQWDDDVDLVMDRKSYERFLEAVPAYPAGYFIQSQQADPLWHYPYTKIRLDGTSYPTEFSARFPEMHQGIFIDLFVQDTAPKDPAAARRQKHDIQFTHEMVKYLWYREHGEQALVANTSRARKVAHAAARFTSLAEAEKKNLAAMRRYDGQDTGMLIDSSGLHIHRGTYPYEMLGEPIRIEFEGVMLPAPHDADAYLRHLYDNYEVEVFSEPHSLCGVDFGAYGPGGKQVPGL